jgi:hypothetical protein
VKASDIEGLLRTGRLGYSLQIPRTECEIRGAGAVMRRIVLVAMLMAASGAASAGGLRAPSCEALIAFSMAARYDPVEVSFGKAPSNMTVDEFDQAIDILSVCIDEVEQRGPDVPGLMPRERKQPQLVALRQLAEDLHLYRSQSRERERQAAHLPK